MDLDALTGLTAGQPLVLYGRRQLLLAQGVAKPGGKTTCHRVVPVDHAGGLPDAQNVTQEFAGAIFGASQSTVSRRRDLLRPVIARAVASFIPHPREVLGGGTVLVDGTITPTWNWKHVPDLYSAKAGRAGMNVQIAASLNADIVAVGSHAVHGAYAFEASGLKEIIVDIPAAADLGYVGVEVIAIVPIKRGQGCELRDCDAEFNTAYNGIRAAIERAVATLKTWRMLSIEAGRYRPPIEKFDETLRAITGLLFFRAFA